MTPEQEKSATRLYWKIKEIQRFLEYKPDIKKERILCVKEIGELLKEEQERIATVINGLFPILWDDNAERHASNIRLSNNLHIILRALTPDTNQTEVKPLCSDCMRRISPGQIAYPAKHCPYHSLQE